MNDRKRPLLLAALPIAWLLFGAPLSARGEGHDQLSAQRDDGVHLMYVEHDRGREISRELAADQRTRTEEVKQGNLDRERQDSRQRSDDVSRYYWWWPFRK